jgi:hypothetical protein
VLVQELEGVLADHVSVHHPDSLGATESRLDHLDDRLHCLNILGISGERETGQGKTLPRHDQGQHDLLAAAAVIAGIAAAGQFVFLG